MRQEMTGFGDAVASAGPYAICTSIKTDNRVSTQPLKFVTGWMPFLPPNQQRQSTEGTVKNWKILLVQSFAAPMPLLTATSAFGLGRRRWSSQQCYLRCLRTSPGLNEKTVTESKKIK